MALWQEGLWQPGLWQDAEDTGTTCLVSIEILDSDGDPVEGVKGLAIIDQTPQLLDSGDYLQPEVLEAVSDAQGVITWPPLLRGAVILFRVNAIGYLREVTVADAPTMQL